MEGGMGDEKYSGLHMYFVHILTHRKERKDLNDFFNQQWAPQITKV